MNELRIASRFDAIDAARRWLSEQLRAAGVGERDVWAVELALTEELSNVIRHAYEGDDSREIRVASSFADRRLEIRIVHWGKPLDRNAPGSSQLHREAEGGYGLELIDELMDEIERRDAPGGGTEIRLVKSSWEEP